MGVLSKKLGLRFLLFSSVYCGLCFKWDANVIYSAWLDALRENWALQGTANEKGRATREQHVPVGEKEIPQCGLWGDWRVNNMGKVVSLGECGFLPCGLESGTKALKTVERAVKIAFPCGWEKNIHNSIVFPLGKTDPSRHLNVHLLPFYIATPAKSLHCHFGCRVPEDFWLSKWPWHISHNCAGRVAWKVQSSHGTNLTKSKFLKICNDNK